MQTCASSCITIFFLVHTTESVIHDFLLTYISVYIYSTYLKIIGLHRHMLNTFRISLSYRLHSHTCYMTISGYLTPMFTGRFDRRVVWMYPVKIDSGVCRSHQVRV